METAFEGLKISSRAPWALPCDRLATCPRCFPPSLNRSRDGLRQPRGLRKPMQTGYLCRGKCHSERKQVFAPGGQGFLLGGQLAPHPFTLTHAHLFSHQWTCEARFWTVGEKKSGDPSTSLIIAFNSLKKKKTRMQIKNKTLSLDKTRRVPCWWDLRWSGSM